MLMGAALGPVGAIGGAIGGAIVGSRAGAAASQGVCDVVESTADDMCESCKAASSKPAHARDWGGGRLGTTGEASEPVESGSGPTATAGTQEPSTGERFSEAANVAGERIGEAASVASEKVSEGWSWVRKSVTSAFGSGETSEAASSSKQAGEAKLANNSFATFSGSGHVLGARSETDASAERPRANPSRLLAAADTAAAPRPKPRPAPAATAPPPDPSPSTVSQLEADEALARQLQEEEERELQRR